MKFGKFADVLFMYFLFIAVCFMRAFVLSSLWSWFIVPLGVISIGTVYMVGPVLISTVFTTKVIVPEVPNVPLLEVLEVFVNTLFVLIIIYATGFIAHLFV